MNIFDLLSADDTDDAHTAVAPSLRVDGDSRLSARHAIYAMAQLDDEIDFYTECEHGEGSVRPA